MGPPIIFLAFANDKQQTGAGYLRGLTAERNAIRDALRKAEQQGLCQVLVEPDVTIDRIFDTFQDQQYRGRIALFHYGGHAESYSLLLETASGAQATAHSEGLVAFLSKQKSLKLVFLNGCSSKLQSEELVAAGLPAVIGTAQQINDTIATGLASQFYKGLSQGMTIDLSWTDAVDKMKTESGGTATSSMYNQTLLASPGENDFPWDLYLGEDGNESRAWNLPEAANQPLFGLELPRSYYRNLPKSPYVGLRSYQQDEAAVFFGRGREIRTLYTLMRREQPLILLSGHQGVGKSSLLAAGLTPRLESEYHTVYCPASAKDNPATTLRNILAQLVVDQEVVVANSHHDDVSSRIAEVRESMKAVTRTAHEVLARELVRLEQIDQQTRNPLHEQWKAVEHRLGKPLILLLDELPLDPGQWDGLGLIVQQMFKHQSALKGKLVFSIDGTAHTAFEQVLRAWNVGYIEHFLTPLDHTQVQEVVNGIISSSVTQQFYRIEFEHTPERDLAKAIANDLVNSANTTLVAPYLQVMMSALWAQAHERNSQQLGISVHDYQKEITDGNIMHTFLGQQLQSITLTHGSAVDSGLILDLLYRHTSALGQSQILDENARHAAYVSKDHEINQLIDECIHHFLLCRVHSGATDLGHQLLAPMVIRRYSRSLLPGQQAMRILNSKISDDSNAADKWLNATDLAIIERGIPGMRDLTREEEALVEYSTKKKLLADREKKRNRIIRRALVAVIAVFAVLAGYQWFVAYKRFLYAQAGERAFEARDVMAKDNTRAMHLAIGAYAVLKEKSPPMLMHTMSDIFHTQDDHPFYSAVFPHQKKVHSAVFSHDHTRVLTASEDGYAKLWDLKGSELLALPHIIEVRDAIFSPTDQQILTLTRTHVSLWNRDGSLMDRDSIPETVTDLRHFSSDGMKIIPSYIEPMDSVLVNTMESLQQNYYLIIPSDQSDRILGINYGVCALYDKSGNVIRDTCTTGFIYSAQFSPDGQYFLTVTPTDSTSIVTMWNLDGQPVRKFACEGTEVRAVFSPDNNGFLTASNDFTAKLWDFSSPFLHRFRNQNAALNTIDHDGSGHLYLTSAYDSTAKIWDQYGNVIDSLKHRNVVTSAGFSSNGNYVFTACLDSTARLWNPRQHDVRILQHRGEVNTAFFSHDDRMVVTASMDSTACLWRMSGERVEEFRHTSDVLEAMLSHDDKHVLTRTADNDVILWNLAGDSLFVWPHPGRVHSIAFAADDASILVASADSLVHIYSSKDGKELHSLSHSEQPRVAITSPDGKRILTGGTTIRIWDTDGQLLDSLVHPQIVSTISFSPNGNQILTTSVDHNAYLWDDAGQQLAVYRKHGLKINHGCFEKDGQHILTAGDDGFVIRWRTPHAIYTGMKDKLIYRE